MSGEGRKRSLQIYTLLRDQMAAEMVRARMLGEDTGREICGLLIDNGFLIELLPLKNRSTAPGSFEMGWKPVRRTRRAARRIGHRVVGTYHSHPASGPMPGESDIAGAEKGSLMLILACVEGEAKLWTIRRRRALEVPFRAIG